MEFRCVEGRNIALAADTFDLGISLADTNDFEELTIGPATGFAPNGYGTKADGWVQSNRPMLDWLRMASMRQRKSGHDSAGMMAASCAQYSR